MLLQCENIFHVGIAGASACSCPHTPHVAVSRANDHSSCTQSHVLPLPYLEIVVVVGWGSDSRPYRGGKDLRTDNTCRGRHAALLQMTRPAYTLKESAVTTFQEP